MRRKTFFPHTFFYKAAMKLRPCEILYYMDLYVWEFGLN